MLELEKYILPEMREIWEKDARYAHWLEVEIAVLEAKVFCALYRAPLIFLSGK